MNKMILEAQRGDMAALKHIIDIFTPFIFKEALRFKIKGYEYEDIIQHGFLSVIKAVNGYKNLNNFYAYCKVCIRRDFIKLAMRSINHFRESTKDVENVRENLYKFTVEDEVVAYEKMKVIYEVVDSLTKEEQEIINRFYIKGDKLNKIAADINLTYQSVRYKKAIAIKKLKEDLKDKKELLLG